MHWANFAVKSKLDNINLKLIMKKTNLKVICYIVNRNCL